MKGLHPVPALWGSAESPLEGLCGLGEMWFWTALSTRRLSMNTKYASLRDHKSVDEAHTLFGHDSECLLASCSPARVTRQTLCLWRTMWDMLHFYSAPQLNTSVFYPLLDSAARFIHH